jgi:N-formylglutamate deformylase
MNVVDIREGDSPVVLGQPHGGMHVPGAILARLNATGQGLADTDWHIGRLYDGLLPGATFVSSNIHRYVVDANRDPSGVSLYPGQNTTGLCPITDFDGRPIWRDGQEPSDDEIAERRDRFHAPYHAALSEQIARVRAKHGLAILYDCHSIRSVIPFLFDGTLPVFNVGTNEGTTCAAAVEQAVTTVAEAADGLDATLNGRFKGGWTTRHYGVPEKGIHAIQMELAQRAYMDEAAPWTYRPDRAARLRSYLKHILTHLDTLARSGALSQHGAAS